MGGEHLAVGIDGDPLALSLLQQHVQVLQVMAGHQDGLSLLLAQGDFGGDRMPIGAGIAGIQEFHGLQVHGPNLQGHGDKVVEAEILPGELRHGLMNEGIDGLILLAEDGRMIGVGGESPETVEGDLLERSQVFIVVQ